MKEIIYIVSFYVISWVQIPCDSHNQIDPITGQITEPIFTTLEYCEEKDSVIYTRTLSESEYLEWEILTKNNSKISILSLQKLEICNRDTLVKK